MLVLIRPLCLSLALLLLIPVLGCGTVRWNQKIASITEIEVVRLRIDGPVSYTLQTESAGFAVITGLVSVEQIGKLAAKFGASIIRDFAEDFEASYDATTLLTAQSAGASWDCEFYRAIVPKIDEGSVHEDSKKTLSFKFKLRQVSKQTFYIEPESLSYKGSKAKSVSIPMWSGSDTELGLTLAVNNPIPRRPGNRDAISVWSFKEKVELASKSEKEFTKNWTKGARGPLFAIDSDQPMFELEAMALESSDVKKLLQKAAEGLDNVAK